MTNLIDHLSLGVPDVANAVAFYDGLMASLGYENLATTPQFAAYGKEAVQFLVMSPENGDTPTAGNGTHICFAAKSTEDVDRFHSYAVNNGGTCAGSPGPREAYPIPDVYAAFVRDPFGNKLEAIHNGFAA